MSEERPRYDAHTLATAGEVDADDLNRVLWLALVAALTTFLRLARPKLGMRHGERCPRCGHSY